METKQPAWYLNQIKLLNQQKTEWEKIAKDNKPRDKTVLKSWEVACMFEYEDYYCSSDGESHMNLPHDASKERLIRWILAKSMIQFCLKRLTSYRAKVKWINKWRSRQNDPNYVPLEDRQVK